MPLPSPQEYQEAVQNPQIAFSDSELRSSHPETNSLGLPKPYSGNFTTTFCLVNSSHKWAVRCFVREISELKRRYDAISKFLQRERDSFFVNVNYLENGIRINGRWHPVIKMRWISGDTLNEFINKNIFNKQMMEKVIASFEKIAKRLEELKVSHGDLQHGNILVKDGELYLIDYDGFYLDEIKQLRPNEIGHPNYQHPERDVRHYNWNIDRFSEITIYLGLKALLIKPELWKRYNDGENILFKKEDFRNPESSQLMKELGQINELKILVERYKKICKQGIEKVPSLMEFIGNTSMNQSVAISPMSVNNNQRNNSQSRLPDWIIEAKLIEQKQVGNSNAVTMKNGYLDSAGGKDSSSITVEWERFIVTEDLTYYNSVQQTIDGGYILAGRKDEKMYILKLKSNGETEWERPFEDKGSANAVQLTRDGGYILAGRKNEKMYILKLKSNGEMEWEKTFEGKGIATSIQQTIDGGYVIAGQKNEKICVLKLKSNGEMEWGKTTRSKGIAKHIQQTDDDGYIAVGQRNGKLYVLRLRSNGEIDGEKTLQDESNDWVDSIQQTKDGGYIVAATKSGDIYILKLKSNGETEWEKTFKNIDGAWANYIQQTKDGGYIVAGQKNLKGEYGAFVMKLRPMKNG